MNKPHILSSFSRKKILPIDLNIMNGWNIFLFLGVFGILFILFLFFYNQIDLSGNKKHIQLGESTGQKIHLELDNRTVDVNVPSPNPNPSKYTAIIIEPRKHNALSFVLQNFTENLNEDWNFVLVYSKDNAEYVEHIFETDLQNQKGRFSFVLLGISKMTLKDYSSIFYNESFYDLIPTETFLVFQTDSIILRENREKINDFLKYDYVGAPWPHTMGNLGYMKVGNGGLSLRKKSKMLELLQYKQYGMDENSIQIYGKYIAEDQFFCGYYIKEVKLYKPYWEKAKEFSIEAVFYEKPFGIHACWKGLSDKEMEILIKLYPDINKLQILNS